MRVKAVVVLGLLLCVISGPAFGQAALPWASPEQPAAPETEEILESQLPLVRARVGWAGEVWVGQAVPLNVEVIVPTWFTGAPKFPEFDVSNAVTVSPEAVVNYVVRSGGKTFAAQGRRYLIFPQTTGTYTIPSAPVEVTFALPDGKPSAPASLASSRLQFEPRLPPGAEGARYFLTTALPAKAGAARPSLALRPVVAYGQWLIMSVGAALMISGILLYVWLGARRAMSPAPSGGMTAPVPAAVSPPAARFVGAQACATCHKQEYGTWRASHHALAMPRRGWMSYRP